jgi:hypothetical protein
MVFENRVLRRIFGPKRDEATFCPECEATFGFLRQMTLAESRRASETSRPSEDAACRDR